MHTIRTRLAIALIAAALLTLGGTLAASAHEHREVGEYEFTVGFLNEPAIVEEPNGLDLRIQEGHGDEGTPVEGLAESLQAEVTFGSSTMALEIEPRFGQPGAYRANFIPTAEGDYTFHVFGTVNGMEVDETFTSSPDTFSSVGARDVMGFPNQVDAVGDVAADVESAQDNADSARLIGIIGIVVGALGLLAGGAALMMARRTTSEATSGATSAA
jgi:hypothetical protein